MGRSACSTRPAACGRCRHPTGQRPGTPHRGGGGRRRSPNARSCSGALESTRCRTCGTGSGTGRLTRTPGRRHLPGHRPLPGPAQRFRGPGRPGAGSSALRGPAYGIHLILTAGRWSDLRMQLQAAIGTKVEFRLNDPGRFGRSDGSRPSTCGRTIPDGHSIEGGLQLQVCLPTPGSRGNIAGVPDRRDRRWHGPGDPVPADPDAADAWSTTPRFSGRPATSSGIVIGVDETDLKPVELDWRGADPHLLVIGDAESGKTSLLKMIVQGSGGLAVHRSGGGVRGVRHPAHPARRGARRPIWAPTPGQRRWLPEWPPGVAGELKRQAAAGGRHGCRPAGPLVVARSGDLRHRRRLRPARPLAGQDHWRRSTSSCRRQGMSASTSSWRGGPAVVSRALYEPVPQRLREVGATGLLLSGDRQEGAIYPGMHLSVQPPGRGHAGTAWPSSRR